MCVSLRDASLPTAVGMLRGGPRRPPFNRTTHRPILTWQHLDRECIACDTRRAIRNYFRGCLARRFSALLYSRQLVKGSQSRGYCVTTSRREFLRSSATVAAVGLAANLASPRSRCSARVAIR
jgi:hypothetical protein